MVNWLACVIVCNVLIGGIHQTRGCGGTYRGQSGTITSPNYPYKYANHLSCTYVITPRKLIGLKFETFNTESGFDYVKVYDGSNNLLASLSGSHNGYTIPSSTYYRVKFTTDRSIGYSGFRAVWRSAPTISGLPSTYRVNKSSRLRLDCSSYTRSTATPTYRWTNRGLTVSTGAVLNIVNINKYQAGQYTCTATNTVGADSAAVNVVVQYSPEIFGLPSTHQVNESAKLRLDCSSYTTQGNPSATTYTWSHGGSTVGRGAVLTRSSISRSQRGEYTCTASNTVGSDSASVNVDVRYSPEISGLPSMYQVNESATLRLDCSSYTTQGNPQATTYTWSHGGSSVGRGAVLTRSSISRSQGGAYTCTVGNTVGSDSASINLTILYSPEIPGLPTTHQVTESATLRLDCSSYTTQGNPSATTYTWSHGGSTVGRGAVLTRSSISRSQRGEYTCTASNTVGSDSASVNVDVRYSPEISGLPSMYQVNESATLRLDCSLYTTQGNPQATTYTWSHGGSSVGRGAVLTRSSISRSQGGAYTCTVGNTVGSDSASINLTILYSPEISGLPTTHQVTESATLRLDCSSYTTQGNPSATTYTWSHGGSTVGRGAVLTRSSISRSQRGEYTCTASNTVGSDSASVNVDVRYSPEISGLPSMYQVNESATLRLDCSLYTTQGNPQATTYTWSHGGSSVGRGAVLTRSSISRSQGGAYTCTVGNTVGSDSASINLTILYSPDISGLPTTHQVTESATLRLDCSSYTTQGNPSATTYTWSHGGSTVGRGAVLTRSSISRSQRGEYTCTASNTVGSDSASVNVDVRYSPEISGLPSMYQVNQSATLRLDCSSYTTQGNPQATTYTWSHGGSSVGRGAVLTRSSISRSQGGAYTCTARNTVGSDSASVNVDVRYSPEISGPPSMYQVNESATLRLDCSIYTSHGNPSATTYTWSHGGSTVGRGAVLTRSSISRSQRGAYTCTARNTVGSDSASVNVTVRYSPEISGLPSTYQMTESATLRLDCSSYTTQGNPQAATYTWSHGGSTVGGGAVLTRSSISRSQGGAYTCTVRNTVGSHSASVNVTILYSPEISGLPSTYQVTESATLRLDCSSYTTQGNPQAATYTWSHGGSTVGRGAVLTRSSISRSQGGAYTCTVRNTVGSDSASVNVTILYSPEISGLQSTYQVNESATLRLDCSIYTSHGNPQATTYSWSHGGSSVGGGAVLTRSSISRSQGGAYTCTVRNTEGSDSASVNVTILYSPEISGLQSAYQMTESSTLRLDCSIYTTQGNPSATTYTWSHGGSTVGRGAVLTRSSISRSQGGAYTCTVRNTVGSDSASVNVTILYSPEISGLPSMYQVTESANLRLDCSSYTTQGNPSATTYSWSHGGSTVSRGAVLTRSSISRSQGGAYTCTVRNTVGSDSAPVNVDVQYPPALSGVPLDYQVIEHSPLRINCMRYTSPGNPSTTNYTWSYGTSTVSTKAVLQLNNINRTARGQYTCTVRNAVGKEAASVTVDVQYSPTLSGFPSTYQVIKSSKLWIDCSNYTTDGNPATTDYSWVFKGSTVSSGAVLRIDAIRGNQGGRYACTASNTLSPSGGSQQQGAATAQVDVVVQYVPSISGLPSTLWVVEESQLWINCSNYTSPGNPATTNYTWSYGQSVFNTEEVLQIDNINRTEGGQYTCTVSNLVGSESASVSVDVQYAPLTSGFPSTYRVTESSSLRIDCSNYTTAGNPPSTSYMWTYGGSTVSTGVVLARRNISTNQGGQYTCIASNTLTPYVGTPRQGIATAQINVDVQYAPSISGLPSTLWVVEESQLWINCSNFTSPGNPATTNFTWSYGQSVFSTEEVLQIDNINRTEGGQYTCTVSNLVESESASVSVDVQYVPSISGFPPLFRVIESSRLWIDCGAYITHGHPAGTRYSWTFNGSQVSASSLLGIDGISRDQAGQYTCTARNTLTPSGGSEQQGEATAKVNVDVQYPPTLTRLPSTRRVTEMSTLRIDCHSATTPGNPSVTSYTWTYNGSSVSKEAVLTVYNISRSQKGEYVCTASNSLTPSGDSERQGTADTHINVEVEFAPSISGLPSTHWVVEESQLWINCSKYTSPGNPATTNYTWIYGQSVYSNEEVLQVDSINRTNAGQYTCTVSNDVGSEAASVSVVVQYAPSLFGFPSSYQVVEYTDLWINCRNYTSPGNPSRSNYTWSYEGSVFNAVAVLQERGINRTARGLYTCTVNNEVGSDSATVNVIVQYPPSFSDFPSSYGVIETSRVWVDCSSYIAQGYPWTTNYTWTLNSSVISTSSVLEIHNTSRNQGGQYTCTAYNTLTPSEGPQQLGSATGQVLLDIQYPPTISGLPTVMNVTEFSSFSVDCSNVTTPGNPGGTNYTWTHNDYTVSSEPQLVLETMSRNQSGLYTCTASNMLRPSGGRLQLGTASEHVSVDVQYGPRDSVTITPSGSVTMVEGTGAFTATCSAECNPSCTITWRKDNIPLAGQMSLSNVSRTDQGDYTCQAQNGIGDSQEKNIRLTVYTLPSVPRDFQVASVTDTSVSLQWTSSFDGGADQTFSLLYKSELESHWLTWNDNIADPGSSHYVSVHIPGLTPAVTYHFQLYATNVYGEGEITVVNTTTTLSQASDLSKHGITIGLAAGLGILVVVALVTVSVVHCRRQTQHTLGGEEPTNLPMNSFMPRPNPFQHGSVDVNTKSCDVTKQSCED